MKTTCVSRSLLHAINRRERRPAVFYLHPWELDVDQPRVRGTSLKTRFRHYLNLQRTQPRLRRLLRDFRWRRVDEVFIYPSIARSRGTQVSESFTVLSAASRRSA